MQDTRVNVQQIAPGLWRWTAHHPEWKDEVGCLYYEADEAVCVIDPLVPEDDSERFWRALDRDVARAGAPVHVLVTVYWHTRSTAALVERLDARVWAPARGRRAIQRRAGRVTDVFRGGDVLPGGVEPFRTGLGSEVVFWIPEHRALVTGDAILGGPLRLCPPSWLPRRVTHETLRESLRPLLELPVERVLVSHGEPVLRDGGAALAAALA